MINKPAFPKDKKLEESYANSYFRRSLLDKKQIDQELSRRYIESMIKSHCYPLK